MKIMIDISLIKNWHEKAKEDYFSRYVFEYLAFEAFLKKHKYPEQDIISSFGRVNERGYIQKIKNETVYCNKWTTLLLEDKNLRETVLELVEYLRQKPLSYDKKWWDCSEFDCNNCTSITQKGEIKDENDFINIIEFWNYVRNNLFHAGKNPDDNRDIKLVTLAYKTLSVFFDKILLPEIEEKTLEPAMWEDFDYRFFEGKAEVTDKKTGACANVYELLFLDDSCFPFTLNNKKIEREYIIERVSFNLVNLSGDDFLCRKEWDRILRTAHSEENKEKLKIYFKDILPFLKSIIGDLDL